MKIVYNPITGSRVEDIFLRNVYVIEPNSMVKYESDSLADYLLEKYGFLQEVTPGEVVKVKNSMERAKVQAEKTEEDKEKEKWEGLSEKTKAVLDEIPSAGPSGKVVIKNKQQVIVDIDAQEGILPDGQTDADGVEWTGPGLEDDSAEVGGMSVRKGKQSGVFKG